MHVFWLCPNPLLDEYVFLNAEYQEIAACDCCQREKLPDRTFIFGPIHVIHRSPSQTQSVSLIHSQFTHAQTSFPRSQCGQHATCQGQPGETGKAATVISEGEPTWSPLPLPGAPPRRRPAARRKSRSAVQASPQRCGSRRDGHRHQVPPVGRPLDEHASQPTARQPHSISGGTCGNKVRGNLERVSEVYSSNASGLASSDTYARPSSRRGSSSFTLMTCGGRPPQV